MKFAAITAMEGYKGKSLEELRLEDYKLGKGGSAVGGFGAAPSGFGAPLSAPAQPAFGQPSQPFGAVQSSSASSSIFGQPAQPTMGFGGFGASSSASTSLFGAAPASQPSSLFGTAPASSSTGFLGFGAAAPASQPGNLFSGFGGTPAPASSSASLFGAPLGGSSLFGSAPASSSAPSFSLFGSASTGSSLFSAPASSSSTGGLGSLFSTPAQPSFSAPTQLPAAAPVSLPAPPKPAGLILPRPVERSMAAFLWKSEPASYASVAPKILSGRKASPALPSPPSPTGSVIRPAVEWGASAVETQALRRLSIAKSRSASPVGSPRRLPALPADEEFLRVAVPFAEVEAFRPPVEKPKFAPAAMIPKLENPGMFMRPSADALSLLTESELARVDHFQVGCFGKGCVTWPGLSDLRFLDIDAIVRFEDRAVIVYPDESSKPPEGEGLNKPAVVELRLEPKNAAKARTNEAAYIEKIRETTESMGAEFLSYDLEIWRFRVAHFSRWGIAEDEWADIDETAIIAVEEPRKFFGTGEWDERNIEDNEIMEEVATPPLILDDLDSRFIPFPTPSYLEIVSKGWSMRHGDSFLCLSTRSGFSTDALYFAAESRIQKVSLKQKPVNHNLRFVLDAMCMPTPETRLAAVRQEVEPGSLEWRIAEFAAARRNFQQISKTRVIREWLSVVCMQVVESQHARSALHWLCAGNCDRAAEILVNQGYANLALLVAAAPTDVAQLRKQDVRSMSLDEAEIFRVLLGESPNLDDWRLCMNARILFGQARPAEALPKSGGFDFSLVQKFIDGEEVQDGDVFLSWFAAALVGQPSPALSLACADYLEISAGLDWQYAAVPLATLPCPAGPLHALALRHLPKLGAEEIEDVHAFVAGNFSTLINCGVSEKFLVNELE